MKRDCTRCQRLECPFRNRSAYLEFRFSVRFTAHLEFAFSAAAQPRATLRSF